MKSLTRFLASRTAQFLILPVIVLTWFLLTDPSQGADTLLRLQLWAQAFLITGAAYLISKSLLGNASSELLLDKIINRNSYASAIAYVGICILRALVLLALLVFFALVQR